MLLDEPVFSFVDDAGRYHFIRDRDVTNYANDTGDYHDAVIDAVDAVTGETLKRVPIRDLQPFCDSRSRTLLPPKKSASRALQAAMGGAC